MRELKALPSEINGITVVSDLGMSTHLKTAKRMAIFRCECGKEYEAKVNSVLVGHRKSCGCLLTKPTRFTHRLSSHPLYRKWSGMITRVTNKKENKWHRYGGRGITICDEWRNNFMSFYDWSMDNGYKKGLTIDRIDNDGNYEPNNCQWITMKENSMKDSHSEFIKNVKVKEICNRYIAEHITIRELAKQYETYTDVISKILKDNNIEIKHRRLKK